MLFSKSLFSAPCTLLLLVSIVFFAPYTNAQVTTVAKILAERDTTTPNKKKPRYCTGGAIRFKRCVCAPDVTKRVQYRPIVKECGRKAAIILNGTYASAFSAVVRNVENADRIPKNALINGCSIYDRDTLGLNKCSVYKAQKVLKYEDERGTVSVHCLGAPGTSSYFKNARRITVKLGDAPDSTNDPIARLCLAGPTKNLN
jgi:hypothetical protein